MASDLFCGNRIILAPMSGVTDVAFRELCREFGCNFTYTEFASTKAISQGNKETEKILRIEDNLKEGKICAQIFGSDETSMKNAALDLSKKNFDFIELNCSCPAPKVFKIGAGSALLNNKDRMFNLLVTLCKFSSIPVFVKLRLGIDDVNVIDNAILAEKAGVSAITVHGRTKKQGYSGKADWDMIFKVKNAVNIPVIGNGDISSIDEAEIMIKKGIDAVSIGRAVICNPLFFRDKEKSEDDCILLCLKYLDKAKKYDIKEGIVKNHLLHFTKGLKDSCSLRRDLCRVNDIDDMIRIIRKSFE
ncbi:MAG: tRNA dihydrouridine synthase [Nanobdellota archaeon]